MILQTQKAKQLSQNPKTKKGTHKYFFSKYLTKFSIIICQKLCELPFNFE